ncbi:Sensory box histidine kinase [Olavius algarvensis associated proteobacterium Delta 3]|nr:Sensory box histidine kinase [Olavius algarvensis associated proteobacterium Delta 3]
MKGLLYHFRSRLFVKIIFFVGITLVAGVVTWAYFNIKYHKDKTRKEITELAETLSDTVMLGTHYAMMLNSREDITQIIRNIGRQKEIRNIRIYNKEGKIKFSNDHDEIEQATNIKDEACYICHRTSPPIVKLELAERIRIFKSDEGTRYLGIISPIHNEPGCSSFECHVHPEDKKVLGALDLVVSLDETDSELREYENGIVIFAIVVFLIISTIVFIIVQKFVNEPIQLLIDNTESIAKGHYSPQVELEQYDEMGQLANAINKMGAEIRESQSELNRKKDEYQTLFEQVPCYITVQDKNYRLIQFNRDFETTFDPKPGDFCYYAYKGRDKKCDICPVEKTFEDGESHYSEETGFYKDGTPAFWVVRTTPIRNENGEIVAAMEMCLDITPRRLLEEKLEKSEKNYHAIFNNIPNPVFVVDIDTLQILDCNEMVQSVYGYAPEELLNTPFLRLFANSDQENYGEKLRTGAPLTQVTHRDKNGRVLYVEIWVSVSEYSDREVLLITTSDITQRLEAEQQLIHAGKMATLGEMATGVAHELNQPLTVIKTASAVFARRFGLSEDGGDETLGTMADKIRSNVDRATKIINHMRDFARKSEVRLQQVGVNEVLERAFDMFSQQFKVRGIQVQWQLEDQLPLIKADPDRLEQVFTNLLVNARDAIEARWGTDAEINKEGKVTIISRRISARVLVEICDTGIGVSEEFSEKIFEPFFTTKEVGKGTGIGLSISYGIVKDFGGNIRCVPAKTEGTCFILEFPTAE